MVASDERRVISKISVLVIVQDVNDSPPKFEPENYEFVVKKREAKKQYIGKLVVTVSVLRGFNSYGKKVKFVKE